MAGALDGLRDYCGYLRVKAEARQAGIQSVTTAIENGDVSERELLPAFYKCLSKVFAINLIDNTPDLKYFSGTLFSEKISRFRELSNKFESLTRRELAAKLSAGIPNAQTGVSGFSELDILQKAIKSGGRYCQRRGADSGRRPETIAAHKLLFDQPD
jgi:hypothetical protein